MSDLLRVGVMASGGGSNLQSLIDACEAGKVPATIAVVLSNKADAYALERARRHSIPALHLPVGKTGTPAWEQADAQQVQALRDHGVGLVCLAGYMRISGPALLGAFPRAVMNIHPALLPAFPGVHVQAMAADYGVKLAGTTVHFADAEFDTGPIIIQAAVRACAGDDGDTLGQRILEQEHRIYPQAVKWFAEGRLQTEGRIVRLAGPFAEPAPEQPGVLVSPALEAGF